MTVVLFGLFGGGKFLEPACGLLRLRPHQILTIGKFHENPYKYND